MKVPTPKPEVEPVGEPELDNNVEQPTTQNDSNEKLPFGKEKFDAGIDVDEDADPKKYIEKLTGKLAQKLRSYNQEDSDVGLNKFVINSLIPAAVPQMSDADAKDVIKKVKENTKTNNVPTQETNQDDIESVDSETEEPTVKSESKEYKNLDSIIDEVIDGKIKETVDVNYPTQNKKPFRIPKFN